MKNKEEELQEIIDKMNDPELQYLCDLMCPEYIEEDDYED